MVFNLYHEQTTLVVTHNVLPDRIQRINRGVKEKRLLAQDVDEKTLLKYIYSLDAVSHAEYYITDTQGSEMRVDTFVNNSLKKLVEGYRREPTII